MPKMIIPAEDFRQILRERRAHGGDRYDEVWNGVYVMSPLADNEHQHVGRVLTNAVEAGLADPAARLFHGCNVTDRDDDWTHNFRCPDVAVFLPDNPAEDRGTHWFGGPDFAVEVISNKDRSRKKFKFYAKVRVRELLLVERRPWRLELYRRDGDRWDLVGTSDPETSALLTSAVLPLAFRLLPGDPRPTIEVTRSGDGRRWTA